jgi:hypothetical protein
MNLSRGLYLHTFLRIIMILGHKRFKELLNRIAKVFNHKAIHQLNNLTITTQTVWTVLASRIGARICELARVMGSIDSVVVLALRG